MMAKSEGCIEISRLERVLLNPSTSAPPPRLEAWAALLACLATSDVTLATTVVQMPRAV